MSFTEQEFQDAAKELGVEIAAVKAVAEVESSGVTLWRLEGRDLPPIRLEAHWFGKFTGYIYNKSHPNISSTNWNPSIAARNPKEAWEQMVEASKLNKQAAIRATSWGAFQIMGDHYQRLGYWTPEDMVDDSFTSKGQLGMFVKFVKSDTRLWNAFKAKDWRTFTGIYNGPGQVDDYSARIEKAYAKHTGKRFMRRGDQGKDVKELQKLLNITADGDFGPVTELKVKEFQMSKGLVADGVVGPKTLAALRG